MFHYYRKRNGENLFILERENFVNQSIIVLGWEPSSRNREASVKYSLILPLNLVSTLCVNLKRQLGQTLKTLLPS